MADNDDVFNVDPVIENNTPYRRQVKNNTPIVIKKVARIGDLEQLRIERGTLYPTMSVKEFLIDIKGYDLYQYTEFTKNSPVKEWNKIKDECQEKISFRVAERHADMIVDNQDLMLRSAKIGVTRAIEMLTKLKVRELPEYGEVTDPNTGKLKHYQKVSLKSTDILNCMTALKTGMEIYRSSMGLSEDSEGLLKVMNELRGAIGEKGVHLTQVNNYNTPGNTSAVKRLEEDMKDYDVLRDMIDMKRKIEEDEKEVETIEEDA